MIDDTNSLVWAVTPLKRANIASEGEFRRVMSGEVTAYTSRIQETDDTPFITASGARVREGIIACPRELEFGTMIEIDGVEYECLDRMNIRYTKHYDIWMSDYDETIAYGRQDKLIYINK